MLLFLGFLGYLSVWAFVSWAKSGKFDRLITVMINGWSRRMTYCLGIMTQQGLVMASDSRTNAGVDNVSTYKKLFEFSVPGDRVIVLCTSGNLSLTQSVISSLERDLKNQADTTLYSLGSLYEVAQYIGQTLRQIHQEHADWLRRDNIDFSGNLLLGGQIAGDEPQLFLIYSQGNFIQATKEMPFLQIGETKYGKPILDRTISYQTPLSSAAKCALLSIDSTMKSNISVGPPIDMVMYLKDSFEIRHRLRLPPRDPYLTRVGEQWAEALKKAFDRMPDLEWEHESST
jgi:putative proteasome-type protease